MNEYPAKLLRVIDGDTIKVSLDVGFYFHYVAYVRLAGYDAPELRTDAGLKAKEYLTDLLSDTSRPIVIKTTLNKEFEKYGRVLGSVMLGDVNINTEMVNAGHIKTKETA